MTIWGLVKLLILAWVCLVIYRMYRDRDKDN
jgi:hypothetical protein